MLGALLGENHRMRPELLDGPTPEEWAQLGFTDAVELREGKQSRVFAARSEAGPVAVKLTDASLTSLGSMETRTAFVAELALIEESVVAPVTIQQRWVYPLGTWYATATGFVDGEALDTTVSADSELMGASLAALHSSMRRVSGDSLPVVDALRVMRSELSMDVGASQPLHGDFNSSNLRRTPAGVRIFDFDDCGTGPVEFDVANALYMVLFDSLVDGGSMVKYVQFRAPFVAGYSQGAERPLSDATLDALIGVRVEALGYWIAHLADAPIGIRTSSPAWLEVLSQFVKTWSELAG